MQQFCVFGTCREVEQTCIFARVLKVPTQIALNHTVSSCAHLSKRGNFRRATCFLVVEVFVGMEHRWLEQRYVECHGVECNVLYLPSSCAAARGIQFLALHVALHSASNRSGHVRWLSSELACSGTR